MHRPGSLRQAFALAAALSVTSGCFKATFEQSRAPAGEAHDIWLDGYLFGLVGSARIDTRFFCESMPAKVGVYQSAGTWALTALSLGVYTPRKARVTCADSGSGRRAP